MPLQRFGIDAAAGQRLVGRLCGASHEQAGGQQQHAHRIHGNDLKKPGRTV
jgi:hypothetical protein